MNLAVRSPLRPTSTQSSCASIGGIINSTQIHKSTVFKEGSRVVWGLRFCRAALAIAYIYIYNQPGGAAGTPEAESARVHSPILNIYVFQLYLQSNVRLL